MFICPTKISGPNGLLNITRRQKWTKLSAKSKARAVETGSKARFPLPELTAARVDG